MKDKLNQSEALFGFCGWLTTRREKTVMSASDDCSSIVELIKQFCEVNNLPDVSKQWHTNLIHPPGEVALSELATNK